MKCEDARLQIGADPPGSTPELEAHVVGCADCGGYRREMRQLDADLRRALGGPLPVSARAAAYSAAPPPTARRWALAASLLLAGVLATSFFALQPRDALATALVAHMSDEPDSWSQLRPVPRSALELVLRRSGVRLERAVADEVVYANSCFLRGRYLPHLVVTTPTGPVTVIVLQGEEVAKRVAFGEGGYSGVLLPVPGGGGGIAVLARDAAARGASPGTSAVGAMADVEAVAARVLAAVQFDAASRRDPARP